MILRVPRLATPVLRHAQALARLAASDAVSAAAGVRHAASRFVVAGIAALFALALACVWALALAWDTPWRTWTAGGLAALFAIVALVARSAAHSRADAPPFAATRREIEKDREMYAALRPADDQDAATKDVPPEVELERTRARIREVASNSARTERVLRFPRSRTMQVLTRGGPAGSAALLAMLLRRRRQKHRRA